MSRWQVVSTGRGEAAADVATADGAGGWSWQPSSGGAGPNTVEATGVLASAGSFATFISSLAAGGWGYVLGGLGAITLPSSVTINKSIGLTFGAGTWLAKSNSFSSAQGILISGNVIVEIDAEEGAVILDGNRSNGAAGFGILVQSGATLVMHGGVVQNNLSAGIKATGSSTIVRAYNVESSNNQSGSNTADGFECVSNALLQTWSCRATLNDRHGFFFDVAAAPGCRLDGYAFGNQNSGASCRSFRGEIGLFIADSNVVGGLAIEFGGCAWSADEIRATNNGLGDSGLQTVTLNNNTTVDVTSAESWWAGQTIEGVGVPSSTTVVGPVTNGATTITISNSATYTGLTTVGIGNPSGYGVELFGAYGCQIGKIIERNNSGYGLALTKNGSPLTTTVSNSGSALTSTQTVIPSTGLSVWTQGGIITIGSETILYEGISGNDYTGCIRGAFGTTAATHADGSTITQSAITQNNTIGVMESNNLTSWDGDPAIHMSGGSTRNHIGVLSAHGRSFALSFGEGFGAANDNSIGTVLCDTISFAIWRVTNGSNNRVESIVARDCWNLNTSICNALLYFSAVDSGAVTTGNVVGKFHHRTIARPSPNATITLNSGATACYIESTRTPSLWAPGNTLETYSRDRGPVNMSTVFSSGTLYVMGGIVIPAGQLISNVTFWSGTTALSGVSHLWFCIVDQQTLDVVAVTADQTGATWGTQSALAVALASQYTPTQDEAVYIGFAIVASGMPTLSGITTLNSGTSALENVAPKLAASSSTGQTTPLGVGSTIGALTLAPAQYAYGTLT